jgi:hypothetical protein
MFRVVKCHSAVRLISVIICSLLSLSFTATKDWRNIRTSLLHIPRFFLSCKANARVTPAKTGHGPHSSKFLCCSMYFLFCVVLCIVFVYMCTVLLPPGGYLITFKYIIPYHISNKMQRYIVYFIWKLLYMFWVVPAPIIRSADNSICSIWCLSRRYCYLSLSWKSWNRCECAVGGVPAPIIRSADNCICSIWCLSRRY